MISILRKIKARTNKNNDSAKELNKNSLLNLKRFIAPPPLSRGKEKRNLGNGKTSDYNISPASALSSTAFPPANLVSWATFKSLVME
jgi:hypothetical protein